MSASEVSWSDLLDLHVVKRLGQILERRLHVQVGFADDRGALVGGEGTAACAGEAIFVCGGAATPLPIGFDCAACKRRMLAAPVVVDGQLIGCAFAPAAQAADDGLLAELLELSAAEMIAFADEQKRRERTRSGDATRDFVPRYAYEGIVGRSRAMQELYRVL